MTIRRRTILLLACVALAAGGAVEAGRTRSWTEEPDDLNLGEADGIAVTQDGLLFLAPRLARLTDDAQAGLADQVWAIVADDRDNVYLGTGPEGRILRIDPGGGQRTHFTTTEPMVTALTFAGNGELLAATAPGGKIYRISGEGRGELCGVRLQGHRSLGLAASRDRG